MPSSLLNVDTNFPTLTGKGSTQEKLEAIQSYLYMLVEQLRYSLRNLDLTNMNATAVEDFTKSITGPITVRIEDAEKGLLAQLQVTAEGLGVQMSDLEGDVNTLQATAQGLKAQIADAQGSITALQATADGLKTRVSNAEGDISALEQTVDGFTLTASSSGNSLTLELKAGRATLSTKTITLDGLVTVTSLANGTTTIDGGCLKTGTVLADKIIGSAVELLTNAKRRAGSIAITGASSADYAVELASNGALRLKAYPGDVWLQNGGNVTFGLVTSPLYGISCGRTVFPQVGGKYYLGAQGYEWAAVYADTGAIITSDREKKHDIEYGLEGYEALFARLKPCRFKYNNGESDRYHLGFISQDVEGALEAAELSSQDFAGFVKSPKEDGGADYALRYEEFIALNTWKLQQMEQEQKKLVERVAELERELEARRA